MKFKLMLFFVALLLPLLQAEEKWIVREGWSSLTVQTSAPMPEEIPNESQARALARDAAIVKGQTALLTYVLQKKARSKKTLAEAEIPSVGLQGHIRGYIKGARVTRTSWGKIQCDVTLVLDKRELKEILQKN